MANQLSPIVKAQMLIRRPVSEVFQAFVDPAVTTKFWFTKSSGPLEPGKVVVWEWEMFGASGEVHVKAVEKDKRILIEWPVPVEWSFESRPEGTLVVITTSGWEGTPAEIAAQAIDAKGGFTFVLAGLKALLEHNILLNLTADHHPDAVKKMPQQRNDC